MPAARAASSRLIPSEALASASRRAPTRPSRSRRASARSSAGVRPVAIGTATMAQAPGLLSLPSQLAARRRRSRLPVAGIKRPFLYIDGIMYCFEHINLFDRFYRQLQRLILRTKPEYLEQGNLGQNVVTESQTLALLKKILPK